MATKPKRRPGRPDALTPEAGEKILSAVRAGAFLKEAAEHAGVDERTVYRWLERGEQSGQPAKFGQFRQALMRARADAHVGAVAIIRRAMSEDWRAAAFYLERTDPKRWGRRTAHEVSGQVGSDNLDREIAQLLEEMADRERDGSGA